MTAVLRNTPAIWFCLLWLVGLAAASEKVLLCYYGSWAIYRPGLGKFEPENVDPNLCTHLVYTFVGITREGEVRLLDPWMDLPDGLDGLNRFVKLREKNSRLKILIGIGGWNEGSKNFSDVANNPHLRKKFARSAADFCQKYGFQGLTLDWEYPGRRDGNAKTDKGAFVELVRVMSAELKALGLLFTAAVGAVPEVIDAGYDVPQIMPYFNLVSIMAYDMHGSWETETGAASPLSPIPNDPTPDYNARAAVNAWISRGAIASQLCLGVVTFGRTFTLADAKVNGVGAPAKGPGKAGPYTREAGVLGYNEICAAQKRGEYPERWDSVRQVPFAAQDDQWVSYENVKSLKLKAECVLDLGLAGMAVWSLETDDFRGSCGKCAFPLLKAIRCVLDGGKPPVAPKLCKKVGLMPDEKDCTRYYRCTRVGQPLHEQPCRCKPGTVFDAKTQRCKCATGQASSSQHTSSS